MMEALERKLVTAEDIARKLSKRPEVVRQLTAAELTLDTIPLLHIEVLALNAETLGQGLRIQRRYRLPANHSLIVGTMLNAGFHILASADRSG